MAPLLCFYCKHWRIDFGEPGYSEWTPGYSGDTECIKDHWRLDYAASADDFRKEILRAGTCPSFERVKSDG